MAARQRRAELVEEQQVAQAAFEADVLPPPATDVPAPPSAMPGLERDERALAEAGFYHDAPMLKAAVAAGKMPPVGHRLPLIPRVVPLTGPDQSPGHYGGRLRILIGGARDVRYVPIISYSRLVGRDREGVVRLATSLQVPGVLDAGQLNAYDVVVADDVVFSLQRAPDVPNEARASTA